MQLQKGEKRGLSDLGIGAKCEVAVSFGMAGVDVAAFGLDAAKKIGDDRYVVLFSNPRTPEGGISLNTSSDKAIFSLDLDALPTSIDRIVFTATHDSRPIGESRPLTVTIDGGKAVFPVADHLSAEKAVMMIEMYRHSSGWKLGTIAAGFAGGLASLIAHFGGEVESAAPAPAPTPAPAPAPAPAPSAPISLKKITLEKSSPSVSLKKTGATFGEILLNLNWTQADPSAKRGFFSSAPKNIDLDLGVLFELKDGYKGCIQALGKNFGSYDREPYIELSGDDRTGAVSAGETIRVNGKFFDQIKTLAVFALIYDGVPNWAKTDGIVRMTIPGQPEIEIRLDEGRDNCRLCGIALIENDNGALQLKRHMRYYRDQKEYADDVGIFLRWAAGSKD